MPTLTVICGLPAVGKTTYAAQLSGQGAKVVTSDEYRRFITGSYGDSRHDSFVLDICICVVRHYLEFGQDVVYDATNPTPQARSHWVELAATLGVPAICIWVDASADVSASRNLSRENVVPDWVTEGIRSRFVPPSTIEGFSDVIRISG